MATAPVTRATPTGGRPWLAWAAGAAGGVALALALPGPSLTPLLIVVPGLLLEAAGGSPTGWRAVAVGWTAGTVHWAVATNWVVPVMHGYGGLPLPASLLCLVVMAAILGLPWAVLVWLCRRVPLARRPWLLPMAWTALEAARQLPPYPFPWNPTAASLYQIAPALTGLPVWGAAGLGWAAFSLGAGLWALIRPATRRTGAGVLAVTAALIIGVTTAAPAPRPAGEPFTVAALQPGTSLEAKWDPALARDIAERVFDLTRQAAASGAQLVLWPESAVAYNLERDRTFRATVTGLARELGVVIVLNSIGTAGDGGYTNSAYLVTGEGVAARYDKVQLVPFGEYVPVFARLAFAEALVREVGRFTAGSSPRPLAGGPTPLGLSICYEVVFADLVAAEVRRGAGLLATVTNDGWYGFSWAPEQHLAQAVLRAGECRRWLARAALTGVSALVDPRGRVISRLDVGRTGMVIGQVQPMRGLVPRVRLGDWWAILCALGTAVVSLARRRR